MKGDCEHKKGCLAQTGDVKQSPMNRNYLRQLGNEPAEVRGGAEESKQKKQLAQRLVDEREHCNMNIMFTLFEYLQCPGSGLSS